MGRKTKTHSWHCGLLAGAAPQLFARRDWAKRRGFFFQGEADELLHHLISTPFVIVSCGWIVALRYLETVIINLDIINVAIHEADHVFGVFKLTYSRRQFFRLMP